MKSTKFGKGRKLTLESLETRQLMAADISDGSEFHFHGYGVINTIVADNTDVAASAVDNQFSLNSDQAYPNTFALNGGSDDWFSQPSWGSSVWVSQLSDWLSQFYRDDNMHYGMNEDAAVNNQFSPNTDQADPNSFALNGGSDDSFSQPSWGSSDWLSQLSDRFSQFYSDARGQTEQERDTAVHYEWPVPNHSRVSTEFHVIDGVHTKMHNGIDIPGAVGTPIVAARDGKVIAAGKASGFGNWIVVQDVDNFFGIYGHVDPNDLPKKDSSVRQGDRIGSFGSPTVGGSEHSTGPHLHFEIRQNSPGKGNSVDPTHMLNRLLPAKHVWPSGGLEFA